MKHFPTLYKKTSTGAIQEWTISAYVASMNSTDATIETNYGQLGSDKIQTTTDSISSGKNIGKKNKTTPFEQAIAEAQAKWKKQKKKGYVESKEAAEAGELDSLIEGGIVPMLAHKFSDQGHKIKYPAYVQPKLDGIRCIAILKNGKCTLWSRTRKLIKSCPHIVEALEKLGPEVDIVFDGELYNHDFKENFEHIVHLVRQDKKPDPQCTDVQYHIYDLVMDEPFYKRSIKMRYLKESKFNGYIVKVETCTVEDEAQAMTYFEQWRSQGYEGAMIRNADGKYVNKRSYDLLKMKDFMDSEYEIVGIDEGRGKLTGHVGAFRCKDSRGTEFLAKMSGETAKLKEYFENHSLWKGKQLTVKYQGLTGANGVPRFPVGIAIRDYE